MVCRVDLSVKQIVIKSVAHLPWTSLHITDRHTHPPTHKTHTRRRARWPSSKAESLFCSFFLLLSGGEWTHNYGWQSQERKKKELFGHRYEAVIPSESERSLRWRHRTAWLKCCDCNSLFPQGNVSLTWLVRQARLNLWLTSPNLFYNLCSTISFQVLSPHPSQVRTNERTTWEDWAILKASRCGRVPTTGEGPPGNGLTHRGI